MEEPTYPPTKCRKCRQPITDSIPLYLDIPTCNSCGDSIAILSGDEPRKHDYCINCKMIIKDDVRRYEHLGACNACVDNKIKETGKPHLIYYASRLPYPDPNPHVIIRFIRWSYKKFRLIYTTPFLLTILVILTIRNLFKGYFDYDFRAKASAALHFEGNLNSLVESDSWIQSLLKFATDRKHAVLMSSLMYLVIYIFIKNHP